jgi:hypothetical protein
VRRRGREGGSAFALTMRFGACLRRQQAWGRGNIRREVQNAHQRKQPRRGANKCTAMPGLCKLGPGSHHMPLKACLHCKATQGNDATLQTLTSALWPCKAHTSMPALWTDIQQLEHSTSGSSHVRTTDLGGGIRVCTDPWCGLQVLD